jgi:amidase
MGAAAVLGRGLTVVRRPAAEELRELARASGFTLRAEDEGEFARIADVVLSLFDALEDRLPEVVAPVAAVRDPGARPAAGADPLNALVRTCRVRAEGHEGLLSGVRVAMKDAIAIAGIPLTCGSRVLQGFVPTIDATVTDRLLRAGAEIVAITNMDDLAFAGGGDSGWYGPTLNPWDSGRVAGGSSSGSAAALFYEGIDVALGGDQGGSIRGPAAWCGVIGLKPTHSLVPYTGIAGIDHTFDHCGPLGRTARDVALLLQAIAGRDPADPRQQVEPRVADYVGAVARARDDLAGLRIGVVAEGFGEGVGAEPATVEAVRETIERLERLGAETRELSLPEHLQAGGVAFAGFIEGMYDVCTSGGNGYGWPGRYWEELAPALCEGLRNHAQDLSAQLKTALMLGRYLRDRHGSWYYGRAQNLRPWLRGAYEHALEGVDVLLMPTTPWRAHEVDPPGLSLSDRVIRAWVNLASTSPTDMTGHPAITLPLAEAGGLPVGVMLVARHFEDDRLLGIAATCERALGWRPERT